MAGRLRQHLLDFGHVAMSPNAVSREALIAFGIKNILLGGSASSTDAALGIDDDPRRLDKSARQSRGEAQNGSAGIAAWVGNQFSRLDPLGKQFGKSIRSGAEPSGVGMDMAIPLCVNGRVCESIVCTQINDLASRSQIFRHDRHAGGMWQGAKDVLSSLSNLSRLQIFAAQVQSTCKARVDSRDRR